MQDSEEHDGVSLDQGSEYESPTETYDEVSIIWPCVTPTMNSFFDQLIQIAL